MRILQTGDWHIGIGAVHVGEAADRVRQWRLDTARRIIEIGRQERADVVLLAGDVFEDNGVSRVDVQRVVDILSQSDAPIYVIPGNHDPLVPGSVWEHPAWDRSTLVTVVRENSAIDVPGGRLYACPIHEKESLADPTAWIDAREEQGICVGLAHGSLVGVVDDPDFPIPADAPERLGLDYLALGHWHRTTAVEVAEQSRIGYSRTHEPTKFGDWSQGFDEIQRQRGYAWIVDIESRGAVPSIRSISTAGLSWRRVVYRIESADDIDRLRAGLESLDGDVTLLELKLEGVYRPESIDDLAAISDLVAARFLYARIDETNLLPEPGDGEWLESLPDGAIRETGRQLLCWCDPEVADGRPEEMTSEIAQAALRQLYRHWRAG